MMKTLLSLLLAAVVVAPALGYAIDAGDEAPDFSLVMIDGPKLTLSQLRGTVVYVDFWAAWCAPCRQTLVWLSDLEKRYGAQGFKVVPINLDSARADAVELLDEIGITMNSALDPVGSTAEAYGLKAMPSGYLIAADGTILETVRGSSSAAHERIEARLKSILISKSRT